MKKRKKPEVFKKAKDAVKHGDRILEIDDKLSSNGGGFMPVVEPHHLLDRNGGKWVVLCNEDSLWLEESDGKKQPRYR